MRNLEQIRAQNALLWADKIGTGKEGGRAVAKKVPAMILSNGFIGALAFAIEDENKSGYQSVFKAIIDHLQVSSMTYGITATEPKEFLTKLCEKDSDTLRAITAEAMEYLNYLRRFAKPGRGEDHA